VYNARTMQAVRPLEGSELVLNEVLATPLEDQGWP
jgi:hypothetical protein